jgi:hypothetical protein
VNEKDRNAMSQLRISMEWAQAAGDRMAKLRKAMAAKEKIAPVVCEKECERVAYAAYRAASAARYAHDLALDVASAAMSERAAWARRAAETSEEQS